MFFEICLIFFLLSVYTSYKRKVNPFSMIKKGGMWPFVTY